MMAFLYFSKSPKCLPVSPFQNIPLLYLEVEKFSQDQGFIFVPEEGILINENFSILQDPPRESKRGFV